MTEKEYFEAMVRLFTEAENTKESIKAVTSQAKEAELDVKAIKAAAKLYVVNLFEEKSAEFEKVREMYNQLAD